MEDDLAYVTIQPTNTDTPETAFNSADSKKGSLTDWETLNADVILLTDANKKENSKEWLEALQNLQHIKVYTNLKLVCVSPS